MKKILAVIGSPRRGETYYAVQAFERALKSQEEVYFEYVFLRDLNLGPCRGCCACFLRGEQYCPEGDDRDLLLGKMMAADGVVFATPNYALQVTAIMKNFLDRFAFVFHRPRFFDKAATVIVAQGVYGGKDIVKYLTQVSGFWGFRVSKGVVITPPPGPTRPSDQRQQAYQIAASARDFKRLLYSTAPCRPGVRQLVLFHAARTSNNILRLFDADYQYYREKAWFESDYYCAVQLNPIQRALGHLFDYHLGKRLQKTRKEQEAFQASPKPAAAKDD